MVEARGLRKIYKNGAKELEVLKGIDLKAEKGEVLAVLGPSGAGKSTLLHLLGGLDSPTSGEVLINGVDIYSLGDMERARMRNRKIGFVFQFYHLLPEFDALENVLMPLLIKGENGKDRRDRGVELLSSVGLEGRMSHKPTGNLDSETGKNIIALLWELNKRRKMTLIIVTHDAQIAKDAKRVLHIRDGKINQ